MESLHVDAERHDVHLLERDPEIPRHVIQIVLAHGHEGIDMASGRANQCESLLPVCSLEPVEKQVLSLQRAADRRAELAAQGLRQPEQERVRQVDHVERRLPAQPVEELPDLLRLESSLPPQHRDGHLAEALRIDLDLPLRGQADHPRSIPDAIEHARGTPEQGHLLFEKHADPAEEHLRLAHIAFVGPGGRVDRRQHDVVAAGEEGRGQRVVAQAAAAVHRPGAAGEGENSHAPAAAAEIGSAVCWNDRRAYRCSNRLPS